MNAHHTRTLKQLLKDLIDALPHDIDVSLSTGDGFNTLELQIPLYPPDKDGWYGQKSGEHFFEFSEAGLFCINKPSPGSDPKEIAQYNSITGLVNRRRSHLSFALRLEFLLDVANDHSTALGIGSLSLTAMAIDGGHIHETIDLFDGDLRNGTDQYSLQLLLFEGYEEEASLLSPSQVLNHPHSGICNIILNSTEGSTAPEILLLTDLSAPVFAERAFVRLEEAGPVLRNLLSLEGNTLPVQQTLDSLGKTHPIDLLGVTERVEELLNIEQAANFIAKDILPVDFAPIEPYQRWSRKGITSSYIFNSEELMGPLPEQQYLIQPDQHSDVTLIKADKFHDQFSIPEDAFDNIDSTFEVGVSTSYYICPKRCELYVEFALFMSFAETCPCCHEARGEGEVFTLLTWGSHQAPYITAAEAREKMIEMATMSGLTQFNAEKSFNLHKLPAKILSITTEHSVVRGSYFRNFYSEHFWEMALTRFCQMAQLLSPTVLTHEALNKVDCIVAADFVKSLLADQP